MRPSVIYCLFLVAYSLLSSQISSGQVQPAVKGRKLETPATWDLFMGGSWETSASQNAYGWDGSLSEYPYRSHPWIGGTIDASGYYYSKLGVGNQLFPIMGGPSVVTARWRIRPFARCMAGAVLNRVSATTINLLTAPRRGDESIVGNSRFPSSPPTIPGPASISEHIGVSAGGGVDMPVGSRLAIRGQADWIEYWVKSQGQAQQSQSQDVIRASGGIVLRY